MTPAQNQSPLESQTPAPQLAVLPTPGSNPNTAAPAGRHPTPHRSRNGKIARLNKATRDMVNRMLQNNLPYPRIVAALDEIGIRVTARNISNWKTRRGYKEWTIEQDQALELHRRQDNLTDYLRKNDASELPEVGMQAAATQFSEFLLKPEAMQLLASEPEKFARMVASLCRLSTHIQILQKERDHTNSILGQNPHRLKHEEAVDLENVRKVYSSKIGKGPRDPDIPHRNYMPQDWLI